MDEDRCTGAARGFEALLAATGSGQAGASRTSATLLFRRMADMPYEAELVNFLLFSFPDDSNLDNPISFES